MHENIYVSRESRELRRMLGLLNVEGRLKGWLTFFIRWESSSDSNAGRAEDAAKEEDWRSWSCQVAWGDNLNRNSAPEFQEINGKSSNIIQDSWSVTKRSKDKSWRCDVESSTVGRWKMLLPFIDVADQCFTSFQCEAEAFCFKFWWNKMNLWKNMKQSHELRSNTKYDNEKMACRPQPYLSQRCHACNTRWRGAWLRMPWKFQWRSFTRMPRSWWMLLGVIRVFLEIPWPKHMFFQIAKKKHSIYDTTLFNITLVLVLLWLNYGDATACINWFQLTKPYIQTRCQ